MRLPIMKTIKHARRLLYIQYVMAKYGLDKLLVSMPFFSTWRFISYCNPWNWFRSRSFQRGVALRQALEDLGPIFIKFGQALSTRPDVVPHDIMQELSKLQDKVASFPPEQVRTILEATYEQSPETLFEAFDWEPLASASIAQVHSARLHSGEEVVVKILRPNISALIERDIDVLKTLARWMERYWAAADFIKPHEVVAEFERHLDEELDLQREAANGAQLKRHFQGSSLLYVPQIHWPYARKNALVMERIYGIPIAHMAQLQQYQINLRRLAERGLEIFFIQVFRHGFFHADMHPGNVFVSTKNPEDPQYICVDFGIIGTLSDHDKRYLVENLYAFFNRDYRRIAILHVESGWVAPHTRIDAFESAIRTVCEPIFEKPLKDISFAQLITRLFQVGRHFKMEIQPQLILLQKTLFATEGLGRRLYPDLNVFAVGRPFVDRWAREQVSIRTFYQHMRNNMPFVMEQLPHMPKLINDVLLHLKEQKTVYINKEKPRKRVISSSRLGIVWGVFLTMTFSAGIRHSALLSTEQLRTLAISTVLISGGLIVLSNTLKVFLRAKNNRRRAWD